MAILALDLASTTGWALQSGGGLCWGTWNLRPGKGRPHTTRWLNLWDYLANMHLAHGLTRIVQESPTIYPRRLSAARVALGLTAACDAWCELKGIPWASENIRTIKKFATGKGNANKDMMLQAARERWGEVGTHDEADALWLLEMVSNG